MQTLLPLDEILKHPEKIGGNPKSFIVLGLARKDLFLSGLLSTLAIHVHENSAKPKRKKKWQSAQAFNNLPTSINDSALKRQSCLKR